MTDIKTNDHAPFDMCSYWWFRGRLEHCVGGVVSSRCMYCGGYVDLITRELTAWWVP